MRIKSEHIEYKNSRCVINLPPPRQYLFVLLPELVQTAEERRHVKVLGLLHQKVAALLPLTLQQLAERLRERRRAGAGGALSIHTEPPTVSHQSTRPGTRYVLCNYTGATRSDLDVQLSPRAANYRVQLRIEKSVESFRVMQLDVPGVRVFGPVDSEVICELDVPTLSITESPP